MMHKIFKTLLLPLLLLPLTVKAQRQLGQDTTRRVIPVAVPFLTITPDARAAGMGDAGVAVSPDANATFWNPAKLAFLEQSAGASISYSPWLPKLVPDMWVAYLSGFKKLSSNEAVAASVRYFNLGEMRFTNLTGAILQDFNPREMAIDLTYSRKLSNSLSIAPAFRFIHSNLAGSVNNSSSNINATPGNTVAVDLSMFYQKKSYIANVPTQIAFGANISNVGLKITYNDAESRDFIPTNLRVGTAITGELDEYNKVSFALDFNKLMVPSPIRQNGQNVIPNKTLFSGIMGSFTDAQGGLSEELQEVMIATGVEYWYNNIFALRGGYFYEHINKGGRQYFTLGAGLRYQAFAIDFAYMVPQRQNHPLADTMRFSLMFNFNKNKPVPDSE